MGLFDAFKKKQCSICGGDIGLLGNRKLEDGNMCKTCAKKLSPFFSDRRSSTVAEIEEQLAYREDNKQAVAAFNITRSLGGSTKILLDEDAGKFMVTGARNYLEENPDVIDFSQVTGVVLDIDESQDEKKREVKNKDGNTDWVSYTPPRYIWEYDFHVKIVFHDIVPFGFFIVRGGGRRGDFAAQDGGRGRKVFGRAFFKRLAGRGRRPRRSPQRAKH